MQQKALRDFVSYPSDFANFVLFPVNYTLGFTEGIKGGLRSEGVIRSPGPLWLAFVPLVLLLRPVPRWAWLVMGLAVCGFLLIVPMHPLLRYLLPFVAPCSLLVGRVFESLSRRRWARRILTFLVVSVLLAQLVPFAGRAAGRCSVGAGLEARQEYLLKADDVYPMAKYAAETLPTDAKVLYVGERLYYFLKFGVDATMGMPLLQPLVDFATFETPADLHRRLRELRFSHVIVNEAVLAARTEFALDMLRMLEGKGLRQLARRKRLVLYQVTPAEY